MLVLRSGSVLIARGKIRLELRQYRLDALHHVDGVGPGLPLNVENHSRDSVHPRSLAAVFDAIQNIRDVLHKHGRIIVPCNRDVLVIVGNSDLIVRVDACQRGPPPATAASSSR
jgi:hypothetical protein